MKQKRIILVIIIILAAAAAVLAILHLTHSKPVEQGQIEVIRQNQKWLLNAADIAKVSVKGELVNGKVPYDYDYDAATMGMSFPINGRIDSRMPIVWTGLNVSEVTATIRFQDGTTAQVIISVAISNDFNSDFNDDFMIY